MIGDVMRFLDNVLSDFINKAPDQFKDAKYSAENIKGAVAQVSEKNIDITVQVAREHIDRLTAQRENQQKFIDNPNYVLEDGTEVEATEAAIFLLKAPSIPAF